MKSTVLLERQHRNIQQLCDAVERGSPSMRESLLPQLASDLVAHLEIEEQLFWPAARTALGEKGVPASHESARACLERLVEISPFAPEFDEHIRALRAVLEPEMSREEQALFPRVEAALSGAETRALAERMMLLHDAAVENGYARPAVPSAPSLPVAAVAHHSAAALGVSAGTPARS